MLHVLSTREWQHGDSQARVGTLVAAVESFAGQVPLEQLLEGWEDALRGGAAVTHYIDQRDLWV